MNFQRSSPQLVIRQLTIAAARFSGHAISVHGASRLQKNSPVRTTTSTRVVQWIVVLAAVCTPLQAQVLKTLVNFQGPNGRQPVMSLVQNEDGNLYGTTSFGGDASCDCGTIFKMTPAGELTTIRSFCITSDCPDGANPEAGLTVLTDGSMVGTAAYLGHAGGTGTIFTVKTNGAVTQVEAGFAAGANPYAAVIQAADGNLYGTTSDQGYFGTIYQVGMSLQSPTTVYQFCTGVPNCSTGDNPVGALVQGTNGYLYGTAQLDGKYGYGTVFNVQTNALLVDLHDFNFTDGSNPTSTLVLATDGYLYGTTTSGGASGEGGTIFKMSESGKLTTLYNFCSQANCADGADPTGGVIEASDGNLYGTTCSGGAYEGGTIFSVSKQGVLTTLYSFNGTDGSLACNPLFQATDGTFYGSTQQGGTYNDGTIFSLSMGLPPLVQIVPASGAAGQAVLILGTNLTGVSQVTFNGTPAKFRVISPSAIHAEIPVGATSGRVTVVTSQSTLIRSNFFNVQP